MSRQSFRYRPLWIQSCWCKQTDLGIYYSTNTTVNDTSKITWDTSASEVITSDPTDFLGGYSKPNLLLTALLCLLEKHGCRDWSSWIQLLHKWAFSFSCAYKGLLHTWFPISKYQTMAPIMPISCVSWQIATTGTTVTLCLPNKAHQTMALDLSSNLPFCTASPLATALAQGHQVNLIWHRWVISKLDNLAETPAYLAFSLFGHLNYTSVQ